MSCSGWEVYSVNEPEASVVAAISETDSVDAASVAESSTDSVVSAVPQAAKVKADIPAKIHLFHFIVIIPP